MEGRKNQFVRNFVTPFDAEMRNCFDFTINSSMISIQFSTSLNTYGHYILKHHFSLLESTDEVCFIQLTNCFSLIVIIEPFRLQSLVLWVYNRKSTPQVVGNTNMSIRKTGYMYIWNKKNRLADMSYGEVDLIFISSFEENQSPLISVWWLDSGDRSKKIK